MDRIHLAAERWPDDKGDWEHRGGWFPSQGQHIYREGMSSSLSLPSVCLSVPLKLSLLSSSLVTSPQGLPPDPHVRSLPPTHRGTHRSPQVTLSPPHTCDIAWFTCSHPETLWAALGDTLNMTFSVETLLALARETWPSSSCPQGLLSPSHLLRRQRAVTSQEDSSFSSSSQARLKGNDSNILNWTVIKLLSILQYTF